MSHLIGEGEKRTVAREMKIPHFNTTNDTQQSRNKTKSNSYYNIFGMLKSIARTWNSCPRDFFGCSC